jgi:hypothetical protein
LRFGGKWRCARAHRRETGRRPTNRYGREGIRAGRASPDLITLTGVPLPDNWWNVDVSQAPLDEHSDHDPWLNDQEN